MVPVPNKFINVSEGIGTFYNFKQSDRDPEKISPFLDPGSQKRTDSLIRNTALEPIILIPGLVLSRIGS
jgi:hypothetical protein